MLIGAALTKIEHWEKGQAAHGGSFQSRIWGLHCFCQGIFDQEQLARGGGRNTGPGGLGQSSVRENEAGPLGGVNADVCLLGMCA